MHSRVAIFSTSLTTTNPRRELRMMHQSNGKSTRSAQVPHSQIPPKQQKLWRNMRGRTRRTPRNPRSRSTRFPSLRGDGLVENVDLNLPSLLDLFDLAIFLFLPLFLVL